MAETTEDETTEGAERKARRLLWWATVLAFVSVAVCGLDVMIKNQILATAKDSQGWLEDSQAGLDRLRRDLAGFTGTDGSPDPDGSAAADGDGGGLAGVRGVRPSAQPHAGPDAGR